MCVGKYFAMSWDHVCSLNSCSFSLTYWWKGYGNGEHNDVLCSWRNAECYLYARNATERSFAQRPSTSNMMLQLLMYSSLLEVSEICTQPKLIVQTYTVLETASMHRSSRVRAIHRCRDASIIHGSTRGRYGNTAWVL